MGAKQSTPSAPSARTLPVVGPLFQWSVGADMCTFVAYAASENDASDEEAGSGKPLYLVVRVRCGDNTDRYMVILERAATATNTPLPGVFIAVDASILLKHDARGAPSQFARVAIAAPDPSDKDPCAFFCECVGTVTTTGYKQIGLDGLDCSSSLVADVLRSVHARALSLLTINKDALRLKVVTAMDGDVSSMVSDAKTSDLCLQLLPGHDGVVPGTLDSIEELVTIGDKYDGNVPAELSTFRLRFNEMVFKAAIDAGLFVRRTAFA